MPRHLAVIPARAGSKRVPGKNIRDFLGRPMLAYSLEAAVQSGLFETIHVSTDSQAVAAVAADMGCAPAFLRDPDLADDHTPVVAVVQWVLKRLEQSGAGPYDSVALLAATAPTLEPADLQEAYRLYDRHGGECSIVPVAPHPGPVERAFSMDRDGRLMPLQPDKFMLRSQDLPRAWYATGMYTIFSAAYIREWDAARVRFNFCGVPMPAYKAIDIDEPDDLVFAEIVCRGLRQMRAT